jgi:hypothetical protein
MTTQQVQTPPSACESPLLRKFMRKSVIKWGTGLLEQVYSTAIRRPIKKMVPEYVYIL